MNQYELAVVLPGGATAAKKKAARELIEQLVKVNEGKINEVEDWGDRELMFPIKKNETGTFMIFNLELNPAAAKALEPKLKVEDQFIRYLLIKSDKSEKKN
jgi:small subunit ribosomal protein S6